jgi:hypothetical protein
VVVALINRLLDEQKVEKKVRVNCAPAAYKAPLRRGFPFGGTA